MTQEYEYRSRWIRIEDSWEIPDAVEKTCNTWAQEGYEVFSILVPDQGNRKSYRLTAKRRLKNSLSNSILGRKFR